MIVGRVDERAKDGTLSTPEFTNRYKLAALSEVQDTIDQVEGRSTIASICCLGGRTGSSN